MTEKKTKQETPEQPGIDWQAKWCEAQIQIAELKEINSILKGYVRHLQRLNEQQGRLLAPARETKNNYWMLELMEGDPI